ncbi:hypothetical protein [Bacillus sp. 95MFCvi2.1]|uniref:hypothetical protein n=1 Tax=Bacillus sp. 95MFCvi2.1 TaxID=1151121 RepID=UPI00037CCEE7|nr:hypothetical protein [Bacillus sp. 95MFCvi2.1]
MDKNMKKIDNIKFQVKQLIQDNLYREVTSETKHNISGIYMIYIDNFTSEKIVPIYIGKAVNIQTRHKQHFEEIISLNRLSYDEYYKYFFSKSQSFYDGNFKACKIFKYMIENNCSLRDFRMTILEEVDEEYLEEKEQEYFRQLLPSFFGFNQINSRTEYPKLRPLSSSKTDQYLTLLQEDIDCISSYYEYGFTKFNLEYAFDRGYSFLLRDNEQLNNEILEKYEEVTSNVDKLLKRYNLDAEENEIQRLNEQKRKAWEEYLRVRDECDESVDKLENEIIEKFKELNIYSNKIPVTNFIRSIFFREESEKPKYRKNFYKYLDSQKCGFDFYEFFDKQIHEVNDTFKERENKSKLHDEACELSTQKKNRNTNERYKMIFPSIRFTSFPLRDRCDPNTIGIKVEDAVLNTCHFKIYISNNARTRNFEIRKDPDIIRFDYCFIDNEGNRTEKKYYIDNETTRNCQAGIEYFEKDFYDMWSINKKGFKISSMINNEVDNSFISVLTEYKHGINDYTIKDKKLIKLSSVLDEVQQLIDEETQFNIDTFKLDSCLRLCMINEGLQNNEFVEKMITKKLPKIKKRKKSSTAKDKKVVDKSSEPKVESKVKRVEAYKQKVINRSNNTIEALNYVSSKEKVTAKCKSCGHEWEIRSDHLLARPYCPLCRKND